VVFLCVRCIAVIASAVTIAPNSTTKAVPNQPKPNITEPSETDCVTEGKGSLAAGSTGTGLATGAFVTTELEEAALDAVLLEVSEEEVELEDPLFVDLFSSFETAGVVAEESVSV